MPQLCTQTYLQGNMLNKSKGPAVQGLRLQIDKVLYKEAARKKLETYKNVTIIEEIADQLLKNDNGEIIGITTRQKNTYHSRSVVITTGTFLNGLIHIGLTNFPAGRKDEPAVTGLAQSIYSLGLRMGRLKTGTPPRLEKQSVSLEVMEEQKSHDLEFLFEFTPHTLTHKHSCYITRTNTTTHEIVKENAHLSPVYKKIIKVQHLGTVLLLKIK